MDLKRDGEIGLITFEDVEDNSDQMFSAFSDELADACAEIASDGGGRVLVMLLSGRKTFGSNTVSRESIVRIPGQEGVAENLAALEIPTLVGMDGYVLGNMLELALACDIRLGTTESYFGFPGIGSDCMPGDGGTQRLPRIVGKGKALEMILTGELVDSRSAHEMGLINWVTRGEELHSQMMDLAREMCSKSPTSLVYAKEAINKGLDLTLEQGLRLEADLYYLMHTTNDRCEGIRAFMEKRNPVFNGS